MFKRLIVKSKFKFLTVYGFKYSYQHDSYTCFGLEYQKGRITLMPSFDYVDRIFDVYIMGLNNYNGGQFVCITDTAIGTSETRMELKQSANQMLKDARKYTHGIPNKFFTELVMLYVNFVQLNIDEILTLTV